MKSVPAIRVGDRIEAEDPILDEHGADKCPKIIGVVIFCFDDGLKSKAWADGERDRYDSADVRLVMTEYRDRPIVMWTEVRYPEQQKFNSGLKAGHEPKVVLEKSRPEDSAGLEIGGSSEYRDGDFVRYRSGDSKTVVGEYVEPEESSGPASGLDRQGYRPIRYVLSSVAYSALHSASAASVKILPKHANGAQLSFGFEHRKYVKSE